jgi:hypothetical protein
MRPEINQNSSLEFTDNTNSIFDITDTDDEDHNYTPILPSITSDLEANIQSTSSSKSSSDPSSLFDLSDSETSSQNLSSSSLSNIGGNPTFNITRFNDFTTKAKEYLTSKSKISSFSRGKVNKYSGKLNRGSTKTLAKTHNFEAWIDNYTASLKPKEKQEIFAESLISKGNFAKKTTSLQAHRGGNNNAQFGSHKEVLGAAAKSVFKQLKGDSLEKASYRDFMYKVLKFKLKNDPSLESDIIEIFRYLKKDDIKLDSRIEFAKKHNNEGKGILKIKRAGALVVGGNTAVIPLAATGILSLSAGPVTGVFAAGAATALGIVSLNEWRKNKTKRKQYEKDQAKIILNDPFLKNLLQEKESNEEIVKLGDYDTINSLKEEFKEKIKQLKITIDKNQINPNFKSKSYYEQISDIFEEKKEKLKNISSPKIFKKSITGLNIDESKDIKIQVAQMSRTQAEDSISSRSSLKLVTAISTLLIATSIFTLFPIQSLNIEFLAVGKDLSLIKKLLILGFGSALIATTTTAGFHFLKDKKSDQKEIEKETQNNKTINSLNVKKLYYKGKPEFHPLFSFN